MGFEMQWHQLDHMQTICTLLQTDNLTNAQFLQAGCSFWCLTNSVKALRHKSRTHSHPFNGRLSRTTQVSQYQGVKTSLDWTEARDNERQWHQLGHMQVCTLLQTDNHASTPPLSFYQPNALPAAQPTASKHWRHKTLGSCCDVFYTAVTAVQLGDMEFVSQKHASQLRLWRHCHVVGCLCRCQNTRLSGLPSLPTSMRAWFCCGWHG